MSNLIIKELRLRELEAYLQSDEYSNSSFVPISRIRAHSHLNNPRADMEDSCLFLAYDKEQLIGYLGVLPDLFFKDAEPEKAFWISCMWILPEYRRHGVAIKLLQHTYSVLNGKMLITNFIPRSKKAFEKTKQYQDLFELEGIRGYLRLDISNQLIRKYEKLRFLKPFIQLLDFFGNLILNIRLNLLKVKQQSTSCEFTEVDAFGDDLKEYINKNIQHSLFRRGVEEFEWMQKYPWVKKVKEYSEESKRYYFSQEGKDFKQWFVQVSKDNQVVGFLILTQFRGEIRTPYLIYNKDIAKNVAVFIAKKAIASRVRTYVGYDQDINMNLLKFKIFLHVRKSIYGFLKGKGLIDSSKGYKIFDGDGDGGFT